MPAGALKIIFLSVITTALPVQSYGAEWYFSYTCSAKCGGLKSSDRVGPYSSQSQCETQRSSSKHAWTKLGASVSVGPCTSSGSSSSGASGSGSNPLLDLFESVGKKLGKGQGDITGFTDPGRVEEDGATQGEAYFSRHGAYSLQDWVTETKARLKTRDQSRTRPTTEVFVQRDRVHRRKRGTRGCFTVAQNQKLAFFRPLLNFSADSPLVPQTTTERTHEVSAGFSESGGQPITGQGVGEGPKDTAPPPTPEREGPGGTCRSKWFWSSETRNCYGTLKSCEGDYRTKKVCVQRP
jgi:hypothetical protein